MSPLTAESTQAEVHRLLGEIPSFQKEMLKLRVTPTQVAEMFVTMRSMFEGRIALVVAKNEEKRNRLERRWSEPLRTED